MSNILKNTVLWTAWLWVTEYASNWFISSLVGKVSNSVSWIINGSWVVSSKVWTVVWNVAPFALAWGAVVNWVLQTRKHWIYTWVQNGLLTYWAPATALAYAWLLSSPLAPSILAVWAGMYWVKKLASVIKDSVSRVPELPGYVASLPWKAMSWTWKWVKWVWKRLLK
jgi:hypothetical protein